MAKDDKKQKTMEGFYEYCLTTCSESRLKKIKWIMKRAEEMIGKDLTKLNVEDVVKFLAKLNKSDFKAWTKNDYKKIFKRFLKWYYRDLDMIEGIEVKLGFAGVSKKRAFNKQKINQNTLLQPEELEKLLRTAKSLKWKALISLAYESAFRPCEITNLKWADLKFDDNLDICRVLTISPKTKDKREIPVKDCVVHLKRWKEEYQFPNRTDKDYVFPSQKSKDKPMAHGVISEMFKRLSVEANMRHIYPYLLRHTRLTELQKRLPEKIVAKFGGHSIETSEIYNHLSDDDVEESMLKEIYSTKEISPDDEHQLFAIVRGMKKEIDILKKAMATLRK